MPDSNLRKAGRLAFSVGAMLAVAGGTASAASPGYRCTNPASGTNWQILVDIEHGRVDNLPAEITDRSISWRDPAQGYFDLDRATGALRLRNASSTGGYFLHYTCKAE